ncbi:MAG: beta-ketoacyl-ACP synthase II [Candidatus Saelkia tenebricola]|nr:beta-ketoacyl-ACP synthase II [Candidatus Saelkia tenebricola]
MKRRVVVTGLGIVSPLGNEVDEFWASILKGRSGVRLITQFDVSNFASRIAGEVGEFNPHVYLNPKEIRRMERFTQFAVYAATKAWEDSGLNKGGADPYRSGVVIGSGIGALKLVEDQFAIYQDKGPRRISPFLIPLMIVNIAPGQVAIALGLKGPNHCVVTACASGSHSIGDAFRIIQGGYGDVMIAGGTESCITSLGVGGFCSLKALSTRNDDPQRASRPFDKERDGFIIGEGAGLIVLEDYEHAKKRNANIYAEVAGYGASCDAYHQTAPDPNGEGAYYAMKLALEDSGVNPEDVDYINAHGTSTQLNDRMETAAIKRLFKDNAYKIGVSSIKSMVGHLLGASGGVEALACVLAIRDQVIPATINYEYPDPDCDLDYVPNESRGSKINYVISNSFGFGGHNACLVFKKV